jgi:uncharacterized protein (DUF2237 family)
MVVACPPGRQDARHTVNPFSTWESPQLARIDRLQPSIGRPPVTLQSTHDAALDAVDLADLKRRALELT